MIIEFDRELTRQNIYANGKELASIMGMDRDGTGGRVYDYPLSERRFVAAIDGPVLCTDYFEIAQLGVDDPVLRDTVMALYGSAFRTTIYDGTALHFEQDRFPGVWGPSIDTLFFCRGLARLDLTQVRTVAEIGTGSGFITKWLLQNCETVTEATMVDFNPRAIEAARESVTDDRARFHVGDGLAFLRDRRVDLVMCNPPYIPRPKSIDDNAYEGVGLLVSLIEGMADYLNPGGRLVLNLSSLADDIALAAIERVGANCRKVDELDVPLKVYNVLNNPAWRDFLVQHKGLEAHRRDGYDYWHTIQLFECEQSHD